MSTARQRPAQRTTQGTVLQRVVLPAEPDRLPLYVEGPPRPDRVVDRRRLSVPAGERVSFATYANAFPASYWQRWTSVGEVVLEVELSAPGSVEVHRSDADGRRSRVRGVTYPGGERVSVPLPVEGFDDGGWYWFDIRAEADLELVAAAWTHRRAPTGFSASVGITTFDRAESCTALLGQIAADEALTDLVDAVYVVDQGTRRLREASALSGPATRLGDRLSLIEQPNLGGSGGFARAQLETLRAGRSDAVLLLDDDVSVDPELLRRAIVFAGLCSRPTIVGGQMLDLGRPTRLHATGERVDRRRFFWGPVDPEHREHDLAAQPLRRSPWLHRRADVDYNGWWACLVPVRVLQTIGLSLPLFLKWDDAEYGVRAARAGHRTVTLPGCGVWHAPWRDKDDVVSWQAYFHQRNRVVAALLHSPHERGGALVPELMAHQVKHLAAMQYSTAELRRRAVLDVLAGPDALRDSLATAMPEARRVRAAFADAQVHPGAEPDAAPDSGAGAGSEAGSEATEPAGRPSRGRLALGVARGMLRQLRPSPQQTGGSEEPALPHDQAYWWRLLERDAVVVSTPDGAGTVHYRRDRDVFVDLLRRSGRAHRRLYREWPELAERYRAALPRLASPAEWHHTFESAGRDR